MLGYSHLTRQGQPGCGTVNWMKCFSWTGDPAEDFLLLRSFMERVAASEGFCGNARIWRQTCVVTVGYS